MAPAQASKVIAAFSQGAFNDCVAGGGHHYYRTILELFINDALDLRDVFFFVR